jgi:hypothetical protein
LGFALKRVADAEEQACKRTRLGDCGPVNRALVMAYINAK